MDETNQPPDRDGPLALSFGVNALTGEPLLAGATMAGISQLAAERPNLPEARALAMFAGDPADLEAAKWGIIFAANESQAVRDALQPFMDYRIRWDTNCVFTFDPATDKSAKAWIERQQWTDRSGRVQHGSVENMDANVVPFYLLIIGDATPIPFEFQITLAALGYGVGRLCFDTPQEYANYGNNVIAYENPTTGKEPRNHKRVDIMWAYNGSIPQLDRFGCRTAGVNLPSCTSSNILVPAIIKAVTDAGYVIPNYVKQFRQANQNGRVTGPLTKDNLRNFFAKPNDQLPALLVTVSHGMGFLPDQRLSEAQWQAELAKLKDDQHAANGALVCQEWPGQGIICPAQRFTAADLPPNRDLCGMVMFSFACYGAGTPKYSYYRRSWGGQQGVDQINGVPTHDQIADRSFVAALPKQLLGQPNGLLGFFGHIEQTWTTSFLDVNEEVTHQTDNAQAFVAAMKALLVKGYPLAAALNSFVNRVTASTRTLSDQLVARAEALHTANANFDDRRIFFPWTTRNDAQSFILLGDPVVSLRIHELPN